jgi:fructosamine-3-kinase
MAQLDSIVEHIESTTNQSLQPYQLNSIGGGCINSAFQLKTEQQAYFIKVNQPSLSLMFEAEALGLQEMSATKSIRVPEVICQGTNHQHSYLVLEYIPLRSLRGDGNITLGEQLAHMHKVKHPFFGWQMDNTIGSTPQINDQNHHWLEFWREHRLGQQLKFAAQNGYTGRLQSHGEKLLDNLDKLLENHHPQPSLLHGDLWGGNAAADDLGQPVIFDPACYYGDRETDLAMTELFGGFGRDFFAAYNAIYPVDSGYATRKTLYNLYHILNHLNLFGGGYMGQAESMIDQLLSEI